MIFVYKTGIPTGVRKFLHYIQEENRMKIKKIETFDNLKHGDKIISPIDNEVTEFYVSKSGDKYLAGKTSLFDIYQFDPDDFYFYNGKKEVGEVDKEYFK